MGNKRGRPRHPDILTPAEWSVVHAVRHGMTNRQIARRRGVSLDAVKFHVANALMKLGMTSRTQLRGWTGVPVDSPLRQKGPQTMTEGLQLGALGQISRPVSDIPRAVDWYANTLGLTHLYTFGDLAFFDCAGTRLYLSVPENGTKPPEPSVLYFRVPDIHAAYEELRSRGVVFTSAPHLIHRHASGMEEWMAFFDDPDGFPLALMTQVQP